MEETGTLKLTIDQHYQTRARTIGIDLHFAREIEIICICIRTRADVHLVPSSAELLLHC